VHVVHAVPAKQITIIIIKLKACKVQLDNERNTSSTD
jgi:hypothetical protein